MLFSISTVRFLSRNIPLRSLTVRRCETNSCSLQSLITKEYCMCSVSTAGIIKFRHTVIPSTQRHFVSITNPLYRRATSRDDEDDEVIEEDYVVFEGDKIMKTRLSTDRLDAVLKTGLQMSRSKIEKAFFSDRIRINGVRPKKKSQMVEEGDEIDIIRRYNTKNPAFLDVSRIEILKLEGYSRREHEDSDDEATMPATLRKCKTLTIDNYHPPFKGNLDDE